ncbi:unnamed protein product [Thelazia callipaeda]|uniref:DUF223 domain-containing protein n=1 Tax=Thelazia callipaeda TaxID=103827 RepID=A0A0N5CQJ4_THECL|nr:unnamed protein product [Thelazia callipaeda]
MLYKGVVVRSNKESLYVWCRQLDKEAILNKQVMCDEGTLSLGCWIVFTIKEGNLIDEFIEIPDVLPTEINAEGGVTILTRIKYLSENYRGLNLLAHSNDLGNVGIFKHFPNFDEKLEHDVWVERTFWCISNQPPTPASGSQMKQPSSAFRRITRKLSKSDGLSRSFDGCSNCVAGNSLCESNVDYSEEQERSSSRQSCFSDGFFCSWPQTEEMENILIVGLITSSCSQRSYVWSMLGDGIIILSESEKLEQGCWIKFVACNMDTVFRRFDKPEGINYIAKNWYIINPVYPTTTIKATVSVQVKLFVPKDYKNGQLSLWTEFFGSVHDPFEHISKLNESGSILGQCIVVRIMKVKNERTPGSKWLIHKVLHFVDGEKAVPSMKSPSFAADALRYMYEDPQIYRVMESLDHSLVRQLQEPHIIFSAFT